MNTCKTCKHFKPFSGNQRDDRAKGGYCENRGKILEDCGVYSADSMVYSYFEGGSFWVGPDFGCIHHEKR